MYINIVLPIALPIALPTVLPIVLPIALPIGNPKMSFGNLQGLTKMLFRTILFYGPKAPGAHRAHI